jgi:hypothetical protein
MCVKLFICALAVHVSYMDACVSRFIEEKAVKFQATYFRCIVYSWFASCRLFLVYPGTTLASLQVKTPQSFLLLGESILADCSFSLTTLSI